MELCNNFPENCDEIKMFIMGKPNANVLRTKKTKDGIHLIIGYRVDDREVQKNIQKLVLARISNKTCKPPLTNSWENFIDTAITNGKNN